MTMLEKLGSKQWDCPHMAQEPGTQALQYAGIPDSAGEQSCVRYGYGESTYVPRAACGLGPRGY